MKKRGLIWWPLFIGDLERDTRGLSGRQLGFYMRLLNAYYSDGAPIPAEPFTLFRICGAFTVEEQEDVFRIRDRYFVSCGQALRHSKCDRVIAQQHRFSERQRTNANRRWHKDLDATALPPQGQGNAIQTQIEDKRKEAEQPDLSTVAPAHADHEPAPAARPEHGGSSAHARNGRPGPSPRPMRVERERDDDAHDDGQAVAVAAYAAHAISERIEAKKKGRH